MPAAEFKNAPPLYGWILAIAAGIVAFGITYLVLDMEFMGAAFIAVAILLVVGVIFTIADSSPAEAAPGAHVTAKTEAAPMEAPVAAPAPAAAVAPAPAAAPVAAAVSAPEPAPAPAAAAPVPAAAEAAPDLATDAVAPAKLDGPIGVADDLKLINGVGPVLEGKLNNLGVYHFWQIARWTDAEVAWVDGFLNFKGRIGRDNWITQAIKLAETSPAKPPR